MGKNACLYNSEWEKEYSFLRKGGRCDGFCVLCRTKFSVAGQGKSAIATHAKGKVHRARVEAVKGNRALDLCSSSRSSADTERTDTATQSSAVETETTRSSAVVTETTRLDIYTDTQAREAEALWALVTVATHTGFRTGGNLAQCFPRLFPDSAIAAKLACGKDKLSYIATYGWGPFLAQRTIDAVNKAELFALSVDESLNKVSQKAQLDVHVRYMREHSLRSEYFSSVFLEGTDAKSLRKAVSEALGPIKRCNMVQLSLDGPNVNKALLSLWNEECTALQVPMVLDTGTCQLHVIHGALQSGHQAVDWKINEFLSSCYYMFKDSPKRRGDFSRITEQSVFPLKFCQHRWVENTSVIERVLHLLPHLRKFVSEVECKPQIVSFDRVQVHLKDVFLEAKLGFVSGLASQLESFLIKYQTNDPMFPFLHQDVSLLVDDLLERLLRKEKYRELVGSTKKMLKLNLNDSTNLVSAGDLTLFFSAKEGLRKIAEKKSADVLKFRKECLAFLRKTTEKILERGCLGARAAKGFSIFSPDQIHVGGISQKLAEGLFQHLHDVGRLEAGRVDALVTEYKNVFMGVGRVKEKAREFKRGKDSLVDFYNGDLMDLLSDDMKKIIRIALVLFSGQGEVERGFSVNKECVIANLHEDSLIAQRRICSYVTKNGGVREVTVPNEAMRYVREARRKWEKHLEDERKASKMKDSLLAEKRKAAAVIKEVEAEKKKVRLEAEARLAWGAIVFCGCSADCLRCNSG
jgi:hypothetical protein